MKKLSFFTKTSYGVGNLGYGTVSQTLNSFVMFFATSVLGISGTLVGFAVALSALWDGVSDPLFGYLSDHASNKGLGKRLRFLFIASFGIAFFNIIIWLIPKSLPEFVKFIWLVISLLGLETFCTMFSTPYIALGIDIAPDYNEQSSVQGFKTVFFILGMILPSLLMMIFMPSNKGQLNPTGYINISLITSALALVCGLICVFGTLKQVKSTPYIQALAHKKSKDSFSKIMQDFFVIIKNKNYGAVILGYSMALVSSAFLISVGMHLFTYSYHFSSTQISILMTFLFLGAIASQPVWIYICNRLDKKTTLNTSLIFLLFSIGITSITFIFRDLVDNRTLFFLVVPCIFASGFGTGALYTVPISMFADVVLLDKIKTGANRSATVSGFMSLAYSTANSVALFFIGILLDLIKFDSSQPVQPMSVQNGLGAIIFLGCSISIALSMLIFSKYTIKRADVLKAQMSNGSLEQTT